MKDVVECVFKDGMEYGMIVGSVMHEVNWAGLFKVQIKSGKPLGEYHAAINLQCEKVKSLYYQGKAIEKKYAQVGACFNGEKSPLDSAAHDFQKAHNGLVDLVKSLEANMHGGISLN